MSDANRVQLAFVAEPSGSFGEKVTGSDLQILRYNSESLKQDMNTTISEELRSDRQISDIARIGVSASGDISFELSYGSHDTLLKSALLDDSGWSDGIKVERQTISADSDDNSLNDSAGGFSSFVANQWIYTSGFSTTANNGYFKIESVTSSKLVLATGSLVDEDAGETVVVQMGSQITNGTTLESYNFEKDFEDLSNVFSLLKGMCINTFNLEIPADGIITGSFGFMGSAEESLEETAGSGSYDARTTTVVMTGANHVPNFIENQIELGILSFSMSLNNNLRTRLEVGTLGVASMGVGSVEITGSLSVHLEDATLYNKYLDQDSTSIAIGVQDTAGNGYVIELPAVKLTESTRNAGGLNTDVIGEFEFRAHMDATEQITIRIVRFPVAAPLSINTGQVIATAGASGSLGLVFELIGSATAASTVTAKAKYCVSQDSPCSGEWAYFGS